MRAPSDLCFALSAVVCMRANLSSWIGRSAAERTDEARGRRGRGRPRGRSRLRRRRPGVELELEREDAAEAGVAVPALGDEPDRHRARRPGLPERREIEVGHERVLAEDRRAEPPEELARRAERRELRLAA